MNFLAHIYLSGVSDEILIGNFIGDYVKGKDYLHYPAGIRQGIMLHRNIDTFTDKHPITSSSRAFVRDKYGKYSGIVVDIFYDHFLASHWSNFSDRTLHRFIHSKYDILSSYFFIFPEGVKSFFPYFVRSNWLEAYSTFDGLESVLRRMAYRTSLPEFSEYAIWQLRNNYEIMSNSFIAFFNEIVDYVTSEHSITLE
jgi:acyl carrier protein phosphodiesterase